jgi:hypothetical protein
MEQFILENDHLIIERDGFELLVESPDAFALLKYHPKLVERIKKEFNDETTLGDIIFITQSMGFIIETKNIKEE